MSQDFRAFAIKLDRLSTDYNQRGKPDALAYIGQGGKDDAREALIADLGDTSMSHWRRMKPIELEARYDKVSDHEVEIGPQRKNRGPWRVLNEGRRGGAATDLVLVGKVRKKTGTRRAKNRGFNQGATDPKHTWDEAVELMERNTPARADQVLKKVWRRNFTGG